MTFDTIFIRFLKNYEAYPLFIHNFRNDAEFHDYQPWDAFYKNVEPDDLIHYAFDWEKTNEGYDFWSNLATRWIDLYTYR